LDGDGKIDGARSSKRCLPSSTLFDNDGKESDRALIDGGGSITAMFGRMSAIAEIAGLDARARRRWSAARRRATTT